MKIWHHLCEVWRYRELIGNLVIRDLKVRYKNSLFGVAWSWLNPLLMMLVYTVFFTVLWGNDRIEHYPVFVLSGLLPWSFFTESIIQATGSIANNAHLVKRVYFPREVLPITVTLSSLVNFLIALPVFFALALLQGIRLSWWALLLPVPVLVQLVLILGLAFLLATVNVFYRDTQHILGVLIQALFFLTPVFYSATDVPQQVLLHGLMLYPRRWLYWVNPMASIISSYRDLLYFGAPTAWDFLTRTALTALVIFILGYLVFLHYSPRFGEEV